MSLGKGIILDCPESADSARVYRRKDGVGYLVLTIEPSPKTLGHVRPRAHGSRRVWQLATWTGRDPDDGDFDSRCATMGYAVQSLFAAARRKGVIS